MKKNYITLFSLTTLATIAVGLTTGGNKLSSLNAAEHGSSCVWEHYSAVEANYFENGSKEYWVCCEHHTSVLEQPTVGIINSVKTPEASFVSSLNSTDSRYAPKIQSDHVIEVKVNSIQSDAGMHTLGTRVAYDNLESIECDLMWENMTNGGWYGFGVSDNIKTANIYTGMKTLSIENNGQWQHKKISLTAVSGANYIYLIAAVGEFNAEATLCIKNLTINYSDTSVVEPANGVLTYWRSWTNDTHEDLTDSKNGTLNISTRDSSGTTIDRCLKLDTDKYSGDAGKVKFRGTYNYKGINSISVDYKIVGGKAEGKSPWLGFGFASSFASLSVYDCFGTSNGNNGGAVQIGGSVQYDGEWHTLELTPNADGYIYFFFAIGELQKGTQIYFDNFKVGYFWNNSYTTETFNTDCPLFDSTSSVRDGAWTTVAR